MVQIVGTDNKHIKRITCCNCASILEYTQSEVQKRTGADYSGGRFVVEFIQCPKCHDEVVTYSG